MPKEQPDFWPEDAEDAQVRAGTDWKPDDDATRSEGEPTYRTRRKKMKRFLHNTTRALGEKIKQHKRK
ncbi:hypothetical protein A3J56_00825 [Candidatus Giovannonibacteria bacterium RIFCSPHIGHO2_02_FULL_46_20]|uniref:Uncharacterized protein n=1 Tax=Candidatus Giovannonibacteria bacterium RIFCSPHIGHO2_02_FULL_46_20 TaxID=1798338 RepID=A0A1F5WFR2_9BACT|nr:MAG: hypothetical protein A3J56_00825 [Candidatus Giovannonibacteria bacterium RIFCSPHIGHO2_02_FULL_46_20]